MKLLLIILFIILIITIDTIFNIREHFRIPIRELDAKRLIYEQQAAAIKKTQSVKITADASRVKIAKSRKITESKPLPFGWFDNDYTVVELSDGIVSIPSVNAKPGVAGTNVPGTNVPVSPWPIKDHTEIPSTRKTPDPNLQFSYLEEEKETVSVHPDLDKVYPNTSKREYNILLDSYV